MNPGQLYRTLAAQILLCVAGCGAPSELELLDDPTEEASERERVHRLMNARVLDRNLVPPAYIEVPGNGLATQLVIQCRNGLASCSAYPSGNACDDAVCNVETNICLAHTFLELAGLRDAPLEVRTPTQSWDIPAQSSATNVGFLKQALSSADFALRDANQELREAGGLPSDGSCGLAGPSGLDQTEGLRNRARVFAASFVEAYHLHAEASEAAVDAEIAMADSAFSTSPGLARAVARAIGGNDLSRSAAAHLLVGGDEGLEGAVLAGFCMSPEHTPQVQAAIQVLREAAVSPQDVLSSTVTTEALMAGNLGPGPASGSVRQRLGELWGRADLANESDALDVAALLNLRVDDFVAARSYLVQELTAFARTRSEALEAPRLVGGGEPSYLRYAGSASDPEPPPDAYFATLARYDQDPDNAVAYSSMGPLTHRPIPGAFSGTHRAFFVDAAISNAADLVANGNFTALAADALDPLALLIADGGRARTARIRFCRYPGPSTYSVDLQVNGYAPMDGVRVVVGEDGLRCAVEGDVEGAPCDLASHTYEVLALSDPASPGFNVATYSYTTRTIGDIADGTRLYAVVPESPTGAGLPGGYVALAGFYYRGLGVPYCTFVPVVPDAERDAADALRPNEDNCSRSSVTCAGERLDARLPLEDELSTDGMDIETSWRYYLNLAQAAAAEADLRGEEVLAAGLENDQRSEGAVEELLDICGAGIDPTDLIDPALTDARPNVVCTSDSDCSGTGPEYRCRGNQCVLDAVALVAASNRSPARNRLMECLGDDSTRDFATLGTQRVCLWRDSNDRNRICQGQDPMAPRQCPVLAVGESNDANVACARVLVPPGTQRVLVTTTLGYFDTEARTPLVLPDPPCAALRRLRHSPSEGQDLRDIVGSNFFRPHNLGHLAARISWEAQFGGFSGVTIDGGLRYRTGTTWQGPETESWPCASAGLAECQTGGGGAGLFCDYVDCTNPDARAHVNDRLFRAVVAAREIAHTGLSGIQIPIRVNDRPGPFPSRPPLTPWSSRERWDLAVLFYASIDEPDAEHFPFESGIAFGGTAVEAWRAPVAQGSLATAAHFNGLNTMVAFARFSDPPADSRQYFLNGVYAQSRGVNAQWSMAGLWANSGGGAPGWFREALSGRINPPAPTDLDSSFNHSDDAGSRWWYEPLLPPFRPSPDVLLDGAELLCQSGVNSIHACNTSSPPEVVSADDLPEARRYLDCVAADIEARGALSVFANMPVRALDALRQESLTGAFPATGGLYSVQVSQLRAGLIDIAETAPLLASEVRQLAGDMEDLRIALARGNIRQEMADVQFMSTVANQIAACASAGSWWGALATCANSLAQIAFASSLRGLQGDEGELDREAAVIEFRRRFESRATNLRSLGTRLAEATESIDAALAEVERLRNRARRALAKALFLDSDAGSGQYAVNAAMRARLNTRRARYANAHRNAVRMAFLARRAVEQRLGVSLSQITDDLPLVAAPATWEASVCTTSGIDYAATNLGDATNFADAYVGDYVDKLERVVESYRLVHAFHEGTDTAVASIRDDLMNVRSVCPVTVSNLLSRSGCLNCMATDEVRGWSIRNCAPDGEGAPMENCVHSYPLDNETSPIPIDHPDFSSVRAFEVVFGRRDGTSCPATCGLQPSSELSQVVDLPPGRYRLSWCGHQVSTALSPQDAVKVERAGGGAIAQSATSYQLDVGGGWKRYWRYLALLTKSWVISAR